jgi:putative GTP pyrophosphokinase
MPEVEYREGANSVEVVLADFDRRKDQFSDLSNVTVHLIETLLREEKIAIHSVQARVKSREKLKSKYCKPDKDYRCLDDISDIVGLRIITYYSDKINQIAEIVEREFTQRSPKDDKRIGKPESFGYSALHMDCSYSEKRLENTEYKRFANTRFEIQITTVIGHAWAEMHHAWYDSSYLPTEEERRFLRLAAVLELAEQEFLEIRNKKDERERIASIQVEAESPDIPITPESLKAFIEQKDIVSSLDTRCSTILLGELMTPMPPDTMLLTPIAKTLHDIQITTINSLEGALLRNENALIDFITRSAPIWNASRSVNPNGYGRGLCITHLTYLLSGARGEDYLRDVVMNVHQSIRQSTSVPFGSPSVFFIDFGTLSSVAKDVIEKSVFE